MIWNKTRRPLQESAHTCTPRGCHTASLLDPAAAQAGITTAPEKQSAKVIIHSLQSLTLNTKTEIRWNNVSSLICYDLKRWKWTWRGEWLGAIGWPVQRTLLILCMAAGQHVWPHGPWSFCCSHVTCKEIRASTHKRNRTGEKRLAKVKSIAGEPGRGAGMGWKIGGWGRAETDILPARFTPLWLLVHTVARSTFLGVWTFWNQSIWVSGCMLISKEPCTTHTLH